MKRREFVSLISIGSLSPLKLLGQTATSPFLTKAIPSSGQHIPVIGMGTSRTFNVGSSTRLRDVRCEVLARFFEMGGRLIDSSPMYGSAEEVVGYCLKKLARTDFISATKVWNNDTLEGKQQFQNALELCFASEIGCSNWAQYFLKWVVSHPGVTCAIPATSKVDHMIENMGALDTVSLCAFQSGWLSRSISVLSALWCVVVAIVLWALVYKV